MKIMVLMSGGLDSSTVLALAVEKAGQENVMALSINYGQKHEKEIEAAKKICIFYGVEQVERECKEIFEGTECSLIDQSKNIPLKNYADQLAETKGNPVTTYVPFRNGLFLAMAASIALIHGCDVLMYGAHRDDAAGNAYPDCSEEFNQAIARAIWLGSGKQIKVEAPFIDKNKSDIVKEGIRLRVPYEKTWSCYQGGDKPCGKCGTCLDRIKAFDINGVEDPMKY